MTKFNLTLLKTQNAGLVNKINLLKSRLKQAEASEDSRREILLTCSGSVETFTTTMKRVTTRLIKLFESILKARGFSQLSEEGSCSLIRPDPLDHAELFRFSGNHRIEAEGIFGYWPKSERVGRD